MNGKLVKAIETQNYTIQLWHILNGKYVISYSIDGMNAESEELHPFEMATVMFDLKLSQLQDAVPTRYLS